MQCTTKLSWGSTGSSMPMGTSTGVSTRIRRPKPLGYRSEVVTRTNENPRESVVEDNDWDGEG